MKAALTGVLWVPYSLDRVAVRGLLDAVGYAENLKPQSPWAQRLMSAPRPAEAVRPPRGSRKVAKPHFLERHTQMPSRTLLSSLRWCCSRTRQVSRLPLSAPPQSSTSGLALFTPSPTPLQSRGCEPSRSPLDSSRKPLSLGNSFSANEARRFLILLRCKSRSYPSIFKQEVGRDRSTAGV